MITINGAPHSRVTALTRVVSFACLVALITASVACGTTYSNCSVSSNSVAQDTANGMAVQVTVPQVCPIDLPVGGATESYAAQVSTTRPGNLLNSSSYLYFRNANNSTIGSETAFLYPDGYGNNYATFSSTYSSGSIPVAFGGALKQDYADSYAYFRSGTASGSVILSYRYTMLASTPGNPIVGQSYTQDVSLTSGASPATPLTYQWVIDGVPQTPSSSSSITTVFSSSGAHTLAVTVTDANSQQESISTTMSATLDGGTCLVLPCP